MRDTTEDFFAALKKHGTAEIDRQILEELRKARKEYVKEVDKEAQR